MTDLPLVTRDNPAAVYAPVVPLGFIYPGVSLTQILTIIWARRWLSLAIMITVGSLSVVAIAIWPRTYSAVASLMVNYEVSDPLNGKELPAGQVGSYIATQVELMQTPDLLHAVVDRLGLDRNPKYTGGAVDGQHSPRDLAAARLGRSLAIYQGQHGSQIIYVNYSASSPTEAALVANTVVEIFREQDRERSTGPPGERARLYAEQIGELKAKVDQAQQDVTAFHQRNGLIDGGNRANFDVVQLAALESRLMEARNARRAAESRTSGNQAVSDQALASPEVQALKSRLSLQEMQLTQLNFRYMPQHPEIIDLQKQMVSTRTSLDEALQNYAANAAGELSVAARLEQSLQQAVAAQRRTILANGQLHDEAARYLLDLESAQSVYRRALEGFDQIMFASGGDYSNISLISRATAPVKASAPRVRAGLLLGCMLAGFLGLGIPPAFELFNRRVRCRDDVERHHGIPVLAEFRRLTLNNT